MPKQAGERNEMRKTRKERGEMTKREREREYDRVETKEGEENVEARGSHSNNQPTQRQGGVERRDLRW